MSRFHFFDKQMWLAPTDLPLLEEEELIGVYLNDPPSLKGALVITDQSLLLESVGGWMPIHYASISKVIFPDTKVAVKALCVLLHGGVIVEIPISGGTQRTSDAFEFIRFLNRVIADRKLS